MNNQETTDENVQQTAEPVFALDIGTRSIIGIVGVPNGDLFEVLAVERMEHTKRAMVDGQIEDIEQTARVANMVRQRLEKRLNLSLHNVCVAAAGRALRTQKATSEMELETDSPMDNRQVFELEMHAIDQAREKISTRTDEEFATLFCVGHTVMRYYLDDYPLSTLLGHRGHQAKADIIATFLPNEVVESLYTTMRSIGLAVSSLTLEPIAAMNAIIPQELRLLNLALVDIGAGTSDIAISNDGGVVAYTMATVAGDEITEAIIREYLVDFDTAEHLKISLSADGDNVEFKNILGFSTALSKQDIRRAIQPAVDALCDEIAHRILEANAQPPAAVFLVGGGSQYPGMCELIAARLGIDANKVAIGGNNYMKRLVSSVDDVSAPDFATPMGIAMTAAAQRERDGFSVTLNGKRMQLFKNGAATVMDVLLMGGYRQSQMMGRSGKSVTFELNSRKTVVRGGHPTSAEILVNNAAASISTSVGSNDVIHVIPAVAGSDAAPTVGDVVQEWIRFPVTFNGEPAEAGSRVIVNGQPAERTQPIHNFDVVEWYTVTTPEELCREMGVDPGNRCFVVNGAVRSAQDALCDQDVVMLCESPPPDAKWIPDRADRAVEPPPFSNGGETADAAESDGAISVTLNQHVVELFPKADGMPYLFVDMLNFVDIDPTKPQGNIVLLRNGHTASYIEPIVGGDSIEIYWDGQ